MPPAFLHLQHLHSGESDPYAFGKIPRSKSSTIWKGFIINLAPNETFFSSRINHNTVWLIYLFINRSCMLDYTLYIQHNVAWVWSLEALSSVWSFPQHYTLLKHCLNVVWGLAHDILWGHHYKSLCDANSLTPHLQLSLMKSRERASTCRPHHAHLKAMLREMLAFPTRHSRDC